MELDLVRCHPILAVEEVEERHAHDLAFAQSFTAALACVIWWRRYAVASVMQVEVGASAIIVWPAASSRTRWTSPSSSLCSRTTCAVIERRRNGWEVPHRPHGGG